MADDSKKLPPGKDRIIFGPDIGDHNHPYVRHTVDHEIKTGIVHVVQDGETPSDDAAVAKRIGDGVYEITGRVGDGPPRVSTDEFKTGWERIFGGKQTIGQA